MVQGQAPELTPDQLVGIAINAISTQASWSGVVHDARRLAESLVNAGRGALASDLLRDCRALGVTLETITSLSAQQGAELSRLFEQVGADQPDDDDGSTDGSDIPL